MHTTTTRRALLCATLATAFASLATAQTTYYWDGGPSGTGTSWATPENWSTDATPVSASNNHVVIDNSAGASIGTTSTISATRTLGSITFSNINSKLPATLNVDANGSGSVARTLTIHSGLTLADTTTTVAFRGNNGTLSYVLGANNTFSVATGANLQFNSGVLISGGFGIDVTGGGTVRLNGQNTFTGGITVASGSTLEAGHSALGTAAGSAVVAGTLTSGQLGTGTLTLQSGSTFRGVSTGARTFQNNLILNGNVTLGSSGGSTITFNSQSDSGDATTALSTPATISLASNTHITALSAVSLTNVISGTGRSLTKSGAANLTLSAANTYSGGTLINEGTLRVGVSASLGTGSVTLGSTGGGNASLISYLAGYNYANDITVASGSGGTLTIGSSSTFASNTIFSGDITLNDDLTVTSAVAAPNRLSFTGILSGAGDITKIGVGEWRVFGANTWVGNLEVSAGLANFTDTSELRFSLADGGVSNSVFGAGSAQFDGLFRIDASAVTGDGSWNLVNVGTLSETFGATFSLSFLDNTAFTDAGGGLYTSGDWTFDIGTGTLTLAAVPEPSAFAALAGLGMLGFVAMRRRRRA